MRRKSGLVLVAENWTGPPAVATLSMTPFYSPAYSLMTSLAAQLCIIGVHSFYCCEVFIST